MTVGNVIVAITFGAGIGILNGVFPGIVKVHGRTITLDQDLKYKVLAVSFGLSVLLAGICLTTPITFRPWHFFGSLLLTGGIARGVRQTIWENQMVRNGFKRLPWGYCPEEPTARIRSLGSTLINDFEPMKTGFSDRNALVCAALSWLAYRSKEEAERYGNLWQCDSKFIESANGLHTGFVMVARNAVFIAFRGTNETGDWLTNAKVWHQRTPWGNVHAGFQGAVEALWPAIIDFLGKTANEKKPLWLTGHSLGGAMAMLSAQRLTEEKVATVSGVYTFGQPMVGDFTFAHNYNSRLHDKTFRFITSRDEVPDLPSGSSHAGTLVYFDRKGGLHEEPGFWWRLRDQLRRESRGLIGEHSIDWYVWLTSQRLGLVPSTEQAA